MSIEQPDPLQRTLRRREALVVVGGLGASALFGASRLAPALAATSPASLARACVLTPEVTEGPYWIANHLTRRNITEGLPGLALQLHLTVLHRAACAVVANADVELWHANATGVYSGFSSIGGAKNGKRFLRGHQKSNAHGLVIFDTIYPGWYRGRTPHIHIKVHVGGRVVHTGQLFFPDPISDAVYRTGAYSSHGQPDTTNSADNIYSQAGGSRSQVRLTKRSGGAGYVGAITLVVT